VWQDAPGGGWQDALRTRWQDAAREGPPRHWAAASGSNQSVRADDFRRAGGFHEGLELNEHRELALRLCLGGARMRPVAGARTYHLTHRTGWRDPLHSSGWEQVFYDAHPIAAVKLLAVFWAGLAAPGPIPPAARIDSLPDLEAAACAGAGGVDFDAVRRLIPGLRDLHAATRVAVGGGGEPPPAAAGPS